MNEKFLEILKGKAVGLFEKYTDVKALKVYNDFDLEIHLASSDMTDPGVLS